MSLEDKTIEVVTKTANLLLLAKAQTDRLVSQIDDIQVRHAHDTHLVEMLNHTVRHLRCLEKIALDLSEDNAEMMDRYLKFLNHVETTLGKK